MDVRVLLPDVPREELLEKVELALDILAAYAPYSVKRLQRYARLLVFGSEGPRGEWYRDARIVKLAEYDVSDPETHPAHVAATIVHETAHAWLDHHGVSYRPDRRRRIEAMCYRAEARFAQRIPGGEELAQYYRGLAGRVLDGSDEEWSNAAFRSRDVARLKALDLPGWATRALGVSDEELNSVRDRLPEQRIGSDGDEGGHAV